ncbi:MAG: hypothetical protein ACRDKL_10460 [Solirubrobacteraceae bacterium]
MQPLTRAIHGVLVIIECLADSAMRLIHKDEPDAAVALPHGAQRVEDLAGRCVTDIGEHDTEVVDREDKLAGG